MRGGFFYNKILDFTSGIIGKCLYSYYITTQKEKKLPQQKVETHGHTSLQDSTPLAEV
jgi:hypothetical protein